MEERRADFFGRARNASAVLPRSDDFSERVMS